VDANHERSIDHGEHNYLSIPDLVFLLVLLTAPSLKSAGQTVPAPAAKHSAIEFHFAAAQRAQRDKDYATAEREYQAVLPSPLISRKFI